MACKVYSNSDNVCLWTVLLAKGANFSYLLRPTTGTIDIVNAKIRVTPQYGGVVLKEYTVGDGLLVVDGTDLRWSGSTSDFGNHINLVFDAYVANVANNKRSFKGIIRINPSV